MIEDLTANDYIRCHELIVTYVELHSGTVDASIVAIAERLGVDEIASLNGRDFTQSLTWNTKEM